VPQIARELNVDAVLEGTVTRDRDRVRITAQLIGAAPEKHLWAEKYEGNVAEVLTLQDAVAKAIAREIQIKVTPREQALLATRKAVDPAAYEAYLRGRYLNPTEANLRKSLAYFQQAIDKDPGYAPAWAEMSETYNLMAAYGILTRKEAHSRARASAEKAMQLDNTLVMPIIMLANVKKNYEWDWAGAEREYRRAIELNPKDQMAHMEYSGLLAMVGRSGEAVAEARRAREVGPLNYWANIQLAWRLYLARQYDQAGLESPKLIEWEPGLSWGYICQASVYLQTGRPEEAVAGLRKAVDVSNRGVFELMYLGHALGVTGARAEGRKVLEEMRGLLERRHVPPEFIAVVYEGLDEREQALQWFEKAYEQRSMHAFVIPDPRLDRIRSEPRFRDIIRRMGLPQ
jgi:tetratricopeptide (TPR) repeat protein